MWHRRGCTIADDDGSPIADFYRDDAADLAVRLVNAWPELATLLQQVQADVRQGKDVVVPRASRGYELFTTFIPLVVETGIIKLAHKATGWDMHSTFPWTAEGLTVLDARGHLVATFEHEADARGVAKLSDQLAAMTGVVDWCDRLVAAGSPPNWGPVRVSENRVRELGRLLDVVRKATG